MKISVKRDCHKIVLIESLKLARSPDEHRLSLRSLGHTRKAKRLLRYETIIARTLLAKNSQSFEKAATYSMTGNK